MVWSSNSLKSCITSKPLRPWAKVLGTVLQCSYFSVISRFPLKTVNHFRNFLAVLPPPTLYKVETRKKFWIHASNIVCGVIGGTGWTCVNWKTLQKRKSGPRLLSKLVDMTTKLSEFRKHYLGAFCCQRDVHVNIDVTKATEYWQPCFSKFAFF